MPPFRFKNFPLTVTLERLSEHLRDCLKEIERGFVSLGFADSFRKSQYQDWQTWSPEPRGSGSMDLIGIVVLVAEYELMANSVEFQTVFDFTTAGSGSTDIIAKLPLPGTWSVAGFDGFAQDGGFNPTVVRKSGADEIVITRYDGANWGIGSGKRIAVWGRYRLE